jgi:hypothetical protein
VNKTQSAWKLVERMPRRLKEVRERVGASTKY